MRFLLLALPLLLSACATAAITGIAEGGKAVADERSLGRQVDDISLYTDVNRQFLNSNNQDIMVNVTVNVRHGRVLLTGNVDEQTSAAKATELAWNAAGVQEVINEIQIKKGADFWNNANDAITKKNLESRLLITKDVWVVSYSIDVVNGTAYLLGSVNDQGEMDRVLGVARTTRGVKRVVNYLKLKGDVMQSRTTPAAPQYENIGTTPKAESYEDKYRSMQSQQQQAPAPVSPPSDAAISSSPTEPATAPQWR